MRLCFIVDRFDPGAVRDARPRDGRTLRRGFLKRSGWPAPPRRQRDVPSAASQFALIGQFLAASCLYAQGYLIIAWKAGTIVQDVRRPPRLLLLRMLFDARTTRPLHGLIWPKDGCASIA